MEEIGVFGDAETVRGFKLAGVRHAMIATEGDVDEKFAEMLAKPGIGLVILSEDTQKLFSQKTLKTLETLAKPVVTTIPGKRAKPGEGSSLAKAIKKAMGIDLKN